MKHYTHSRFDRAAFHYNICTSTNDMAQRYIRRGRVAEGTVFIADYQYKGKGQRGITWTSAPAQNLLFSFVLYPLSLKIEQSFCLNIMASLALYEALTRYISEGITIKWPNDIYYFDKKLAGMLIETNVGHVDPIIKSVIIGIGLNVNQMHFEWTHATSLSLCTNTMLDRSVLFTHIMNALGKYYGQLQNGMMDLLRANYLDKLYRKTGFYLFKIMNETIKGRIVDINTMGQLVIENNNGGIDSYYPTEIAFLPSSH